MSKPSYIVKGDNPEEATKLCDYLIKLLPQVGLSNAGLARKLGVPANTVSLWRRDGRIPLGRVIQVAKILGLDPIYIRNRALKEYSPDLFVEDERLREFADLTQNERQFLEILRASGKRNPKMNDEQKKRFAEFVAELEDDNPTNFYEDNKGPGRRS